MRTESRIAPPPRRPPSAATGEHLLMARVARLYHELGLSQTVIAERLDLSQSSVSRLLSRARAEGIVRISVETPPGACPELEEALQSRYGLKQALVVDAGGREDGCGAEEATLEALGGAAASFLATTVKRGEVVGISSASRALRALVRALPPTPRPVDARVVEIMGTFADATAEEASLVEALARGLGGEARPLPAPALAASGAARHTLQADRRVAEALSWFDRLGTILVGIGDLGPEQLLNDGAGLTADDVARLTAAGAVGDVCLRFFDAAGRPVPSGFDDRVIGVQHDQLRRARRVIGIAGGKRKRAAIRAALLGRWVNVLVTDRTTAEALLRDGAGREGRA